MRRLANLYATLTHCIEEFLVFPDKRKIYTAKQLRSALFNQQADLAAAFIQETIFDLKNMGFELDAIIIGISRAQANLRSAKMKKDNTQ